MKKLSLAEDGFEGLGLLREGMATRETEWTIPDDLEVVDLIELYFEIESALETDRGSIVQFVGASSGTGAVSIALDMSWAAVSILGKKILVLNCTRSRWTMRSEPHSLPEDDLTVTPISGEGELVKVSGHELYLADLLNWQGKGLTQARTGELTSLLQNFCHSFDMVVAVPPSANNDPLAAILARCVDGNILVIEAERTRRSAAIRLREILSRSGRPIIGAVLHDRHNHIPPWLARLL